MIKRCSIGIFAVLLSFQVVAQFGGQHAFEFMNVPGNARLASLGGVNVSLSDRDVNFFLSNPALVSDSLTGFASASYQFYVADIGMATFAYSHKFKTIGSVSFGVQHMNYGEITGYDASGVEIGSFKSGETVLVIGKSHQVSNFRMGANLKTVFSNVAGYRASALLLDIGGIFVHPTQDLTVGVVFKNMGFVLSDYSEFSSSNVPFDVQVGSTFKPEHMPLRFSLTAYNIATKGNAYDDPDDDDNPSSFDKFLGHINVGAEILFHRNVNVLVAYNFLRHQELKTENTGGSGFCFGASMKIKALEIVVSRTSYSVGNAAYGFTLAANVQNMFLKKRTL